MFLHVSVCPRGGLQAHTQGEVEGSGWGGLQAHTWGRLRGLAWGGGLRPTPRVEVEGSGWVWLQAHPGGGSPGPGLEGCIPACTEADPPSRQLLLRAVRILLECILVLRWLCFRRIRVMKSPNLLLHGLSLGKYLCTRTDKLTPAK